MEQVETGQLKELEETVHTLNQKVAELDLVKRYLESILGHIRQGIIFIDTQGTLSTYNPAAERMLGYSRNQVLHRPFWEFFEDDCFGFSIRESLESKQSLSTSVAATVEASGRRRDLEVYATYVSPVPSDDDNENFPQALEGLILIVRDVTELRRLENQAHRNDRMKEIGEMAAMVAHEIRNPLGGIKGFASLLSRELKTQPKLKQMADYILEGTESLNDLVTQVLNYSRPLDLHLESVDLKVLLEDVQAHVQADETLKGKATLELIHPKDSVIVPVDAALMRRAILNLVVNGIQATPHGGTVRAALSCDGEYATIKVIDKGTGITPENLKKIFTPFFTTKPQGNGFGLPEVQKVVQCHAGHIELSSKVGDGTVFTIKIPCKVSHGY